MHFSFSEMNQSECLQLVQFMVPVLLTTLIGTSSLVIWLMWDEWKLKREEAEDRNKQTPAPLEVEEIPRQDLYFQKLAIQMHTQQFSEHRDVSEVVSEALEWMGQNKHPNEKDLEAVLDILTHEEATQKEVQQAQLWMHTAFLVWSKDPSWIIPAWSPLIIRRNRSWTMQ
jgi:hypothetical protein